MENKIRQGIRWLIFIVVGILIQSLHIEYVIGIKLSFTGIIIVFLIRQYSTHMVLISLALIYAISTTVFSGHLVDIFFLLEAVVLSWTIKRNDKSNLVLVDGILSFFVKLPLCYLALILVKDSYNQQYISFVCIIHAVNSIIAILIGEVLYQYTPVFLDIFKKDKIHKIRLRQFLFHTALIMVTLPILCSIYVNARKNEQLALKQIESYSHGAFQVIQKEVNSWKSREKQKFILYDVVYREKLKSLMDAKLTGEMADIILTNEQHKILVTTNDKYKIKNKFDIKDIKNIEEIDDEFYRVIPSIDSKMGVVNQFMNQFYIVHQYMVNPDMHMYVLIYKNDFLVNDLHIALDGLKLLLILWGMIIGVVALLEVVIFRSITQLEEATKNLPDQLYDLEQIKWKESCTVEIGLLQNNFYKAAFKLKEMFESTKLLNEELSNSQQRLQEIVFLDTLTHIGNRLKMRRDLNDIREYAYYDSKLTGVFLLDINQFKQINDTLGHEKGDKLLIEVAERLKILEDEQGCKAYRLGGDEFVVLTQQDTLEQIQVIGECIVRVFESSFIIDGVCMQVKGSIGMSIYPYHTNDVDTAIKYADMAMYRSKEIGNTPLEVFNESIKLEYIKRTTIEKSIRDAISNNEFEMYYQPVYDIHTKEIINLEALLRWNNKYLGQVSPQVFIPIAEELGFMMELDQWVIQNVCRQIKMWKLEGKKVLPVSINISEKYFRQKPFIIALLTIIEQEEVTPEDILIEIAESSVIEQAESMGKVIGELYSLGIKVILDDFGKTHSSISQLIDLPVKQLKVDHELIKGIDYDKRKQTLVELIVQITSKLGMTTIAEGVETEGELAYLKSVGCNSVQGRVICEPSPLGRISEILSNRGE